MKRRQVSATVSVESLKDRAKWAGLLPGVEPLTQAEREVWDRYRRSQSDWVPQAAVSTMWDTADRNHGDGWDLLAVLAALDEDRIEIEHVSGDYPDQRDRLDEWLASVIVTLSASKAATTRNCRHLDTTERNRHVWNEFDYRTTADR